MKKKQSKACYLCGKLGANTRDHIPPRGIFPRSPSGQLITVPAHSICNFQFSQDDRLFRDLVIFASERSPLARKAWDEQVARTWTKDRQARKQLQDRLTKMWVNDNATGLPSLQDAIRIDVAVIQRQVERWTRGLFYHRFRVPLSLNVNIQVSKLFPPEISMVNLNKEMADQGFKPRWVHVEPNVFSYFYGVTPEDKEKGIAFYVFFDTEAYMAITKVT